MSKTYTVKQVAQALGFSTNTVYKYLDEGKIEATRLGKEGRFRIPEKEVIRLLGLKGENPQIASELEPIIASDESRYSELVSESHEIQNFVQDDNRKDYNDKLGLLNKVSNPDLFDWFLALSAIFLGVAFFLFPITYQTLQFEPYKDLIFFLKMGLVVSGLILMASDILIPVKNHYHHLLGKLPISLVFLTLSWVFYSTADYFTLTYFATLAFFSLLSSVWHQNTLIRFMLFVFTLTVSSGLVFAKSPQAFFYIDLRYFIDFYPGVFEILLILGATALISLTILSYLKNQGIYILLSLIIGLIFFITSIDFTKDQAWNRAVVALMIASFTLIFPFQNKFDSLSRFTRRDILMAFSWMILVLFSGTALVYYNQASVRSMALSRLQDRAETGSQMVDSFVTDGIKATQSYAQSAELIRTMTAPKKDIDVLDRITKSLYLGTTTIRRITLFDENGKSLSYYPPIGSTKLTIDISDWDYFQSVKSSKKTVVSNGQKPKVISLPIAIYIGVPILDDKGEFKGMLSGGLDLDKLADRLTSIESGEKGFFAIADQNKRFLVHKNKDFLGQTIKLDTSLVKALDSQSGAEEGYSEEGELVLRSFGPIKNLGWGISALEPISEIFKQSSIFSFLLFLATILSGIGTLMTVWYLRRRQR